MSYLDNGYNDFLEQPLMSNQTEYSDLDTEALFGDLGASKITGSGSLNSQDGRMSMNLGEGSYTINDGIQSRVELGKFSDNEYGLRIYDREGNLLFDISGTNNLIKSGNGNFEINLSEEQLKVKNNGLLKLVLGKL